MLYYFILYWMLYWMIYWMLYWMLYWCSAECCTECSMRECFTICSSLYSTECCTWSFYHFGRTARCWSRTQMRPDLMLPPSATCSRRSTSCHATGAFDLKQVYLHLHHQMGLAAMAQRIRWSKNKESMFNKGYFQDCDSDLFTLISFRGGWTLKTTLNQTCRTPSSTISCQWS